MFDGCWDFDLVRDRAAEAEAVPLRAAFFGGALVSSLFSRLRFVTWDFPVTPSPAEFPLLVDFARLGAPSSSSLLSLSLLLVVDRVVERPLLVALRALVVVPSSDTVTAAAAVVVAVVSFVVKASRVLLLR